MNLAETLCKTFCDGVAVDATPSGFVVSTPFEDPAGDRITFYLVMDQETDRFRLEDDGSLVPTLIAMGTNVTEGQRKRLFDAILRQSGVEYDDSSGELRSRPVAEQEVPAAALRFLSMLNRVASLSAMRPELIMSTFREDAVRRIKAELSGRASITEREPVSHELSEVEPDLLLRGRTRTPVAVFIAVSDARLYEAIFLRMAADHEAHQACSVVALIEKEGSRLITSHMRQRAQNRLDAVPVYYGEESAAIARIAREADIFVQ